MNYEQMDPKDDGHERLVPTGTFVPRQVVAGSMFGREDAIATMRCVLPPVGCGQQFSEEEISSWDRLTYKEYLQSGWCKTCQDVVFKEPDETAEPLPDGPERHARFSMEGDLILPSGVSAARLREGLEETLEKTADDQGISKILSPAEQCYLARDVLCLLYMIEASLGYT